MGQFRTGPPEALVLALGQNLGLREFVETGTYLGNTAAWAADHFERVTTIELSPKFHAAARDRFANRTSVQALQGASPAVLMGVVPKLASPALFWLDAHWSGFDTAGQEAECPVPEELALINRSPLDHVVLVDDARLFCAPPPRPHRADHWPSLSTLVRAIEADGRRHVVLFEDVFVGVPQAQRAMLTDWLQRNFAQPPAKKGFLARFLGGHG